jgi:hypothetical protein
LAQGCTGQIARVQIERFTAALPSIKAFEPPRPELAAEVTRPLIKQLRRSPL